MIVVEPRPIDASTMFQHTSANTFRTLHIDAATTDYFSCLPHDRDTFKLIEQLEVNWFAADDRLMEKLALCAYKSTLPLYVRQDRNARMWEHLVTITDPSNPELMIQNAISMAESERRQASRTKMAKDLLEEMIRNRDFQHMTHIVFQTGPEPIVAANTFFTTSVQLEDELPGSRRQTAHAPQFITAYPSTYGQTVIRSWITPHHPSLTLIDPSPRNAELRHIHAQGASALVLQESEVITISPKAWENYGKEKQQALREHFQKTTPYWRSPISPIYEFPDPQLINLFNTTPLVLE